MEALLRNTGILWDMAYTSNSGCSAKTEPRETLVTWTNPPPPPEVKILSPGRLRNSPAPFTVENYPI